MTRVLAWALGIVGAIAVFFGLVLLFVDEDQYVSFLGSTWRAGDIASAWTYGLLIGGGALLAAVVAVVLARRA